MANYTGMFISNEFHVSDERKLRDIAAHIMTDFDSEVEVYKYDSKENPLFFIGCYDDCCGYETEEIRQKVQSGELDRDSEEYTDAVFDSALEWTDDIAKILPDNEACIIVFIGNEKMRYVNANAVVITNRGVEYRDLWNIADQTACDMLKITGKHNFHIN